MRGHNICICSEIKNIFELSSVSPLIRSSDLALKTWNPEYSLPWMTHVFEILSFACFGAFWVKSQ